MPTNQDWGQDDEVISSGSEDWGQDDEVVSEKTTKPRTDISKTRSGVLGAVQGTTMGFGDELQGANQAIVQKLANVTNIPIPDLTDAFAKGILKIGDFVTGSDNASLSGDVKWFEPDQRTASEAYTQSRDMARDQNRDAEQANPGTYKTSEFVGSIAPSVALPAARVTKGVGTGAKIANAAATGGSQGAAFGLGHSEGESVGEVATDTLKGGAIGASMGGAFQAAVPAVKKVAGAGAKAIRDLAETQAYKAVGGMKSIGNKLANKGLSERDVGRFALDEKIVAPFRSTDKMLDRTDLIKQEANAVLDDVYQQIDAVGGSQVTVDDLISRFNQFRAPNAVPGSVKQIRNDAIDMASEMARLQQTDANGVISAQTLRTLRKAIDEEINWAKIPGSPSFGKHEALHDARTAVKDSVSDSITDPAELSRFNVENNRYRMAEETDKILENKIRRDDGNSAFGLRDSIAGAAGFSHNPVTALAAAGSSKVLREHGNAVAARSFDSLSRGLQGVHNVAEKVSEDALGAAGNMMSKPVINETIEKKEPQYMLPQDVQSYVTPEMQDKRFSSIVDLLNQTSPEFRKKSREDNE